MSSIFFPELNEKNIRLVKRLYSEDPTFFEQPNCPYSTDIIEIFTKESEVLDIGGVTVGDLDFDAMTNEDYLLAEVSALYKQLKDQGDKMANSDTASEKNTYFKLSAALLERLISMKERVINIKKMNEFTNQVLKIMEDTLDPDQKTTVMKRLRVIVEE